MTTCVTEGARWERHERGMGEGVAASLVSHILQLCRSKLMHTCTALTKSEEKELVRSVLACLQICFVFRKKKLSFGYLIIPLKL